MTEHAPRPQQERRQFREEAESLWRITLAPATWAIHFVLSYGAAAVVCAKAPALVGTMRLGLGGLTALALALIAWLGWRAWRQWDLRGSGDLRNARGKAEDRHHFLGHAAVLLAVISALGVIYGAMPVLLIGDCR